jgi:hypothetical protein
MSSYTPPDSSSGKDPKEGEQEYWRIVDRSEDALRRVAELDKDWDDLAAALDQTKYADNETEKFALMLHLLQLSAHIHEAEVEQPSNAAREYAQLERRAANLSLRQRALEAELEAIHDDFHLWAEEYGVELETEEVVSPMDLTTPRLSGAFGAATPLPPKGHVLNSHSCRDIGNNVWRECRKYCKIKDNVFAPS